MRICPIVEGFGEVQSVPVILRNHIPTAEILTPIRISLGKFLTNKAEFHRTVSLATRKAGADGIVLILIDGDNECPVALAQRILADANEVQMGYSFWFFRNHSG